MPMIPGGGMSPYPETIEVPAEGGEPEAAQESPDEMISMALDMIRQALSADGLSEQERLTIEKVTTLLQQIPATREKEQQAALGGGPATNFLRRNSGA